MTYSVHEGRSCIFQGIDTLNTSIGYIMSNDYGYKNRYNYSMTGIAIEPC